METENQFDVIISTCDLYSDLWDANLLLLEQNWPGRPGSTFLVTDRPTNRVYPNVTLLAAGEGKEITERLAAALEQIHTDYVLLTLEDYFLTEPIYTEKIVKAIGYMEAENIDYLRLYPATKHYLRREGALSSDRFPGFYLRNMAEGDYKISLYPGLWRTSFMRNTVSEKMNAWQYEIALTDMARQLNARCSISNNREFPFLDVIRKGKVLRKAHRYFQKNPIYSSDRKVMKAKDEFLIQFRTVLRHWLPKPLFFMMKRVMTKCGIQFMSPDLGKSSSNGKRNGDTAQTKSLC